VSVEERARVMKLRKEKKAQRIAATTTQSSTPEISLVSTLPPVWPKAVAPTIVVPEVVPNVDKGTTPIISNVSFVPSCPDPDWIMKAVAANRHEAIIENQVVEARFVSKVVTGCPVIELLNDDDVVDLDTALVEAPGVTPGVTPGVVPSIVLCVVLSVKQDAAPTLSPGANLASPLVLYLVHLLLWK
jgi:hypothetical protein